MFWKQNISDLIKMSDRIDLIENNKKSLSLIKDGDIFRWSCHSDTTFTLDRAKVFIEENKDIKFKYFSDNRELKTDFWGVIYV